MMLHLARTMALASLSLAAIHPMGVVGPSVNSSAPEPVMHVQHVSGLGSTAHGAANVRRATSCQSGQYLNNGQCTNCQPGYYCTGGTAQPTACSPGTWNDQPSSNSAQSCKQVQCGYKPTGGQSNGAAATGQTPCGVGNYSKAGSTTCTTCPAGYYCNAQTTCDPKPCDPGTYADTTGTGQQCKNCPAGTFNNSYANTSCCPCCAGYYNQNDTNHTNCQQCPNIGGVQSPDVTGPVGSSSPSNCKVYTGAPGQSRAPATCTQQRPPQQTPGTCPATSGPTPSGAFARRTVAKCAPGLTRCEVKSGRGGFECIDTKNSLDTCGGCDNDCSMMAGTNEISCVKGHCVVQSCASGYALTTRGDGVSRGGLDVGKHCVPAKKRNTHVRHASMIL